jgi:hypothetical protein
MIFIDAPSALHYTGFLLLNLRISLGRSLPNSKKSCRPESFYCALLRSHIKVQQDVELDFRIHATGLEEVGLIETMRRVVREL